jgi:hypothetical protein
MKKKFLELEEILTETIVLSEGLSMMMLEKVDSLYANSRQVMCTRYKLGNGAFSRV